MQPAGHRCPSAHAASPPRRFRYGPVITPGCASPGLRERLAILTEPVTTCARPPVLRPDGTAVLAVIVVVVHVRLAVVGLPRACVVGGYPCHFCYSSVRCSLVPAGTRAERQRWLARARFHRRASVARWHTWTNLCFVDKDRCSTSGVRAPAGIGPGTSRHAGGRSC